jgi:hypothetical protein
MSPRYCGRRIIPLGNIDEKDDKYEYTKRIFNANKFTPHIFCDQIGTIKSQTIHNK